MGTMTAEPNPIPSRIKCQILVVRMVAGRFVVAPPNRRSERTRRFLRENLHQR